MCTPSPLSCYITVYSLVSKPSRIDAQKIAIDNLSSQGSLVFSYKTLQRTCTPDVMLYCVQEVKFLFPVFFFTQMAQKQQMKQQSKASKIVKGPSRGAGKR